MQTLQSVRDLLAKAKGKQLELENKEATLVKENTQVHSCELSRMTTAILSVPVRIAINIRAIPYQRSKTADYKDFTAAQNKSKLTALEDRNSKLEYQILHLKRAVQNGDTALKAVQSQP